VSLRYPVGHALLKSCALAGLLSGATAPSASVPPQPWNADGHRIVCSIAWQRLAPAVRAEVDRLIALDPLYDSFADACVWPDEVRALVREGVPSVQRLARYATAHYVNTPPGSPGVDPSTCTTRRADRSPSPCVLDGIAEFSDSLQFSSSDQHRLEALKFVGHFVADLHQPLHAGYGEDRGGNDTRVNVMGLPDRTLHWVWDGFFLEHAGRPWAASADSLAAGVRPVDARLWSDSPPLRWADESYQIVERDLYASLGVQPGDTDGYVDQQYFDRHIGTVQTQLQKAGVRLAGLLNTLLSPAPES